MMIESNSLAVASKVVHTAACNLTHVHGNFLGTTADRWLQLHDAKALPANTAVPVMVWPLYNAGSSTPTPFDIVEDLHLENGAVFAVSSTRATLTASADTMDIFVHGDSSWDNTGASVAGDYTTDRASLQVWADADGPKRLLRIEASDPNGNGAVYVQVHAKDTPLTGEIPLVSKLLLANGSVDLFFNLVPFRTAAGAVNDGCAVVFSTTAATFNDSGLDFRAKATYRA